MAQCTHTRTHTLTCTHTPHTHLCMCQPGERHDDLTQSCRQCEPGSYGMQDEDTQLGFCVACQIGAEVHAPLRHIAAMGDC